MIVNLENHELKNMKNTVSQLLAIGAAGIPSLCFGIGLGFPTILIPELSKKNAEIIVTVAELTWIGSLNFFCQPLGCIAGGFISRHLGRRNLLILSSVPCTIAWLLLSFSGSAVWPIFLGFIILGLTSGLISGPIQVYASEISEPKLRGSIASIISTIIVFGIFVPILIGSFIYWRTLALINAMIPVVGIIALYFIPESPYWFACKGRLEESQRSLAWLRGWTTIENVSIEFAPILRNSQHPTLDLDIKIKIRRYFRNAVLFPFAIVTFSYFVFAFGGTIPILLYSVPIFQRIECPIDAHIASYSMAGLQSFTTMSLIFLVPWVGKRMTIFASIGFAGMTTLVIMIYTFLRSQQIIDQAQSSKYSWIPSIFLILSVCASFGLRNIPWIMAGEFFPGDVREEVAGIAASLNNIFDAMSGKVFLYMVHSMSFSGTFLFFTIVNFTGLGVLYYYLPETEGRTLSEIQRYFEKHSITRKVEGRWKDKKIISLDNTGHAWRQSFEES